MISKSLQPKEEYHNRALKESLPDVQQRRMYVNNLITQSPQISNSIVVRVEPHPEDHNLTHPIYLTRLISANLRVATLMGIISQQLKQKPQYGVYLFVNKKVLPMISSPLSQVYNNYKEEDGILYFAYASQETF